MSPMNLRPYQLECLASIRNGADAGLREMLVVLPTGTGKTRLAAHMPDALGVQPWESTLFLVLSDEQREQAVRTFSSLSNGYAIGVEMADSYADPESDIVVASVQTMQHPARRERFDPSRFRLVIADEAHHTVSRQYMGILEYFGVLKGERNRAPDRYLCGQTATPRRTDTRGLERVFSKIVFQRSIRQMIDDGYLADLHVYRVTTSADISHVSRHAGDFSTAPLQRAVNTPERNALIVQKYLGLGKPLPALAFTVDVAHSEDLAQTFRHYGVEAYAISGKTPSKIRRELVAEYRSGEIPVLCSCEALGEGADFPIATVGLMARPTESSLKYCQQVGRVLRPWPAPEAKADHTGYVKEYAIIFDFADFAGNHRLFNSATLFGLNADFDLQGKSARRTIEEVESLERKHPTLDLRRYANLADVYASVERVDPFSVSIAETISKRLSRFAWIQQGEDTWRLSLANGTTMWVSVDQLGQAQVFKSERSTQKTSCGSFDCIEEAFAFADSCVPIDAIGIALSTARWRKAAPSEKQARLLWRLDKHIRGQFSSPERFYQYAIERFRSKDKSFTKGAFSQRIDMHKFNSTGGSL